MANPTLLSPADGAAFLHNEIIAFHWNAEPALLAPLKFDLYVGRDKDQPHEDPYAVMKRWLFTPGNAWTTHNEAADSLGLHPGETYYWQVVREDPGHGMTLFSEVRSLRIKPLLAATPPGFRIGLHHPTHISLGSPFAIELILDNKSSESVRLSYATEEKFAVEIYATRGVLSDKYVWPPRRSLTAKPHHVDLAAGTAITDRVTWDQTDLRGHRVFSGSYRLLVYSLAAEYRSKAARDFTIVA